MNRRKFVAAAVGVGLVGTIPADAKQIDHVENTRLQLGVLQNVAKNLEANEHAIKCLMYFGFTQTEAEVARKAICKRQNISEIELAFHRGVRHYIRTMNSQNQLELITRYGVVDENRMDYPITIHGQKSNYAAKNRDAIWHAILVSFRTGKDGFAVLEIDKWWLNEAIV